MMRDVSNMLMKRNPVVPLPDKVGTEHTGALLGYIHNSGAASHHESWWTDEQ